MSLTKATYSLIEGAPGNVLDYGADPTGAADSAPAFIAALAAHKRVRVPSGVYLLNSQVSIPSYTSLVGDGNRASILRIAHTGVGVYFAPNVREATIDGFELQDGTGATDLYTGIRIGSSAGGGSAQRNTIKNVWIFNPYRGIELIGQTYFTTMEMIDVYGYADRGVSLDADISGLAPSNNYISLRFITGKIVTPRTSNYGLYFNGSVNRVTLGEIQYNITGIKVLDSNNFFVSGYVERNDIDLIQDGGVNYYGPNQLAQNTTQLLNGAVANAIGGKVGLRQNLLAPGLNTTSLTALYYFDDGAGEYVLDCSGNDKHIYRFASGGNFWTKPGFWGDVYDFDLTTTPRRGLDPLPSGAVDFAQPFTMAMLVKETSVSSLAVLIQLIDGTGKYLQIRRSDRFIAAVDWNGSTATNRSATVGHASSSGWQWIFVYFDPVAKTMEVIDPVVGVQPFTGAIPYSPDPATTTATLMRAGTNGINGALSFCGFWQRKLTIADVTAIANLTQPYKPVVPIASEWNTPTLRVGAYHLWVDATGDLRIKGSAPTSDTDGTVVGTQT